MDAQGDGRRFAVALGIGLVLELGGLALLLPAMSHKETPATVAAPVKLSIVAPAPAPKPPPVPKPAPKPVPPKPVTPPPPPKPVTPPPPPLPMAPPLPPPPPRPVAHHFIRHVAPPRKYTPPVPHQPQPPQPQPQPRPPVAQTPPPPPAPPAPTGGQVDAFSAAIKRALQAHANQVYPQAAQMAGETGAPQLTFTYLNGVVTGITLTRSSGYPLLDKAALEDARIASYPPPPQGFQGRTYHITVTVTFQMAAPDVDGD
ncbi:MAG TPA: TonB family protein [Acidocella sp.]|nr:TonB family protein [Acidocella sp.]